MYGKVFASLWEGTMYGRGDEQLVLVYLIANADPDGVVDKTPLAISGPLGWDLLRTEAALEKLLSPDPDSRSKAEEGRRITLIDPERNWGYRLVNYQYYRDLLDQEMRREQNRQSKRRQRDRQRLSADVSNGQQKSAQEEGEVEEEVRIKRSRPRSARPESEPEGFPEFYHAYPRRDGRRAAAKAFAQALGRHPRYGASDLLAAAGEFAKQVQGAGGELRFVPMPATWLNQDRFREFFEEEDHEAQVIGGGSISGEGELHD